MDLTWNSKVEAGFFVTNLINFMITTTAELVSHEFLYLPSLIEFARTHSYTHTHTHTHIMIHIPIEKKKRR